MPVSETNETQHPLHLSLNPLSLSLKATTKEETKLYNNRNPSTQNQNPHYIRSINFLHFATNFPSFHRIKFGRRKAEPANRWISGSRRGLEGRGGGARDGIEIGWIDWKKKHFRSGGGGDEKKKRRRGNNGSRIGESESFSHLNLGAAFSLARSFFVVSFC